MINIGNLNRILSDGSRPVLPPSVPAAVLPANFVFFLCSLLFVLCSFAAHSQENHWYEPIFLEVSAAHYFLPEPFSGFMRPQPGFRAALGYEYRRFRFSLEAGYTHIEGTNPLVLDIKLAPLAARAGYSLPLGRGFALQADAGLGILFSRTVHYKTVIDMLMNKLLDDQVVSPFIAARLYAAYNFPYIKLYAGGGVDMILETEGQIPLSVIEAGISIKPFALFRPKAGRKTE
jgi:hypothetical protein